MLFRNLLCQHNGTGDLRSRHGCPSQPSHSAGGIGPSDHRTYGEDIEVIGITLREAGDAIGPGGVVGTETAKAPRSTSVTIPHGTDRERIRICCGIGQTLRFINRIAVSRRRHGDDIHAREHGEFIAQTMHDDWRIPVLAIPHRHVDRNDIVLRGMLDDPVERLFDV